MDESERRMTVRAATEVRGRKRSSIMGGSGGAEDSDWEVSTFGVSRGETKGEREENVRIAVHHLLLHLLHPRSPNVRREDNILLARRRPNHLNLRRVDSPSCSASRARSAPLPELFGVGLLLNDRTKPEKLGVPSPCCSMGDHEMKKERILSSSSRLFWGVVEFKLG